MKEETGSGSDNLNIPKTKFNVRRNPYSKFLEKIEKPARYIGGEHFMVKKNWETTLAKVALCFPDAYEIGMSHLGFKILYDELNRDENILAERVFSPWIDMEAKMREEKLPLVSLESYRPLSDFDILGFSLQYEMTYTNILNMLDLGGVPLFQKDRNDTDPFVISGGPCATHPEPIAPFMDFIVVGDGEDLFVKISLLIGAMRKEGASRLEILTALSKWKGIYVPSFYNTEIDDKTEMEVVTTPKVAGAPEIVERFFVNDLKNFPIPTKTPIPHLTAIFDRYSVELARGCTEGCRFCQAGMIYRPVRERRPTDVIESVMSGLKEGGFNEASLTCLSTADYSAITPLLLDLLDKMKDDNSTLGISSLRAYGLDNRIFDKLSEVKNTSLTFAPEGGTERMRKVINKNISEEDMLTTAKNVFERGWQKMKLYFMIGLPTEEDEDVIGIMETANKARIEGRRAGVRSPNITVSASSFVPKPHTPFQWSSMISLSEIERKQEMLYKLSRQYKLSFRKHLSKTSFFEGIVARGDRKIANVIFDAWKKGARFDGWHETFNYELWTECLTENNINPAIYLGTIRMDGRLPWDHINVGLKEGFLEREWLKATKDRLSPPCGKPAGAIVHHSNLTALEKTHTEQKKKIVCYHCGVACDLTEMVDERRDFLTSMDAVEDSEYEKPEHIGKNLEKRRKSNNENKRTHPGYKYRIEFSKIGSISFISHLDLQKVVMRIFKRAEIDVLYSEGHNPRPLFAFGPALTLGISSLSEFFDVRTPHQFDDLDKILKDLNLASEKGISFRSIAHLDKKVPSIQEASNIFKYFIPTYDLSEKLKAIVEEIKNKDEIIMQSYSKKRKAFIPKNIRSLIEDISFGPIDLDEEQSKIIDEFSPCRDMQGLIIKTKVDQGTSIRPSELVELASSYNIKAERPIKIGIELN